MSLLLNEEQEMLRASARDFLRENSPVSQLRKLRDNHDPAGFPARCGRALPTWATPACWYPKPSVARVSAWSKPAC